MIRLLPTKVQWNSWSLPSKLGCIGTYLGALSIILTLVFFLWPAPKTGTVTNLSVTGSPGTKLATAINSPNAKQIVADNVTLVQQGDNYARLREVANIHGDGHQWNMMGDGFYSHGPSVVYEQLSKALDAFKSNRRDDAIRLLSGITKTMPEWPFGYYYLGVVSVQPKYFEEAVKRCSDMRDAGIKEPAVLLCEAISLTALQRYDEARERLVEIEKNPGVTKMALVVIPYDAPKDIRDRIKALTPNNWKNTPDSK